MINLIRVGSEEDARAAVLDAIPDMELPDMAALRVVGAEFRRRGHGPTSETFGLTVVVAGIPRKSRTERNIALVIDGWRKRDLVGVVVLDENADPRGGVLSAELSALLDPPLSDAARQWRARARITFEMFAQMA